MPPPRIALRGWILAMWCLAVLCSAAPGTAESAVALHVIPFPGTPYASPSSRVIFESLRPSELRAVTVTGSRSGRHGGRLIYLPDGAGTSFVPEHPFSPGETVRVSAALSSPRAGTAVGDTGATRLRFSFGVAATVLAAGPSSGRSLQAPSWMSASNQASTQSFHSAPDLHPPLITATSDPDRKSGDIFTALLYGDQLGPMILDPSGRLVWFLPGRVSANLAVQRYQGQPVLTWWQRVGNGPREDVIMDRSYRTVAIVPGGDGYQPDAHDFQITPQGTAYLSTARIVDQNLSSVGGPANGTAIDDVVQEVDIKTGQVLWEWHTLGHVPLSASYGPVPTSSWPPYDYFHLNSIQPLPNGNVLISSRQTWGVYEISRKTGRVIWTLGGKYSSFQVGPGANFEWQHDARLHGSTLSVFDDADSPAEESQSSGKLIRLDLSNRTASLLRRYTHSPPVLTPEMGSLQTLPNGNAFLGWGPEPEFSEYTPGGRQIFNAAAPLGVVFYRAFRFPWVGHPRTRPSLAVSRGTTGRVKLYASWNGATQVAAWRVLGGSSPNHLRALGTTAPRTGFETTIKLTRHPRYFAVQALGRRGNVLGVSAPARGR